MTNRSETVVFDTEPLIAYFDDEPGSDEVEEHIESVRGDVTGFISQVNRTEVHYLTTRVETTERADAVLEIVKENGIRTVGCGETWRKASYFKREYAVALGDAFALATAEHVDGTLLVGADDDFTGIAEVDIERFRTEPV